MQLLKASDFMSIRTTSSIPTMTICLTGVISLNNATVDLLKLKPEDRLIFTQDKDGDYFIGRAADKKDLSGFLLRLYNKSKGLQFNAKSLVTAMVKQKDLALAPDKKKIHPLQRQSRPH